MRLRLREDAPGLLAIERSGPGRGWGRRVQALVWVNVVVGFIFVPSAVANPFCYIPMVCEAKAAIDFVKDPLGFLLQKLAEANIWFLRKMLELIQNTTKVDLTSQGFLKQYAIIFAASSLITAALWFIAVAKRAVRGVGLTEAISEAIGFLLLQFLVNALTPGAIALLMRAIDEVTKVFEPYATENFKPFLENLLKIMAANPSEGVGQLLVVNLIMMCGALLMWVEMLIRGAAIYVAVALGPVVNAGLVDRDLWGKSKKWIGAIFAIGLSKPVLFALLGLGGAILSDSTGSMSDAVSKILVGALILLLAVFASATLYKWVPAFGDEMAQLHHGRKTAQSSGPAAAVDGPGQHANRALNSHIQSALVGGGKGGGAAMGTAAGPVGAGIALAKAGTDAVKGKAMSSPGAQGTDAGNGGESQQDHGNQDSQAPSPPPSARTSGAQSDPSVGSGSPTPPAGDGNGAPADHVPDSARSHGGTTNPVVTPNAGAPSRGPSPVPAPPGQSGNRPAPSAPRPPAPSFTSGTTAGTGPSTTPNPPAKPTGGGAPIKPPTSKDK
ncbi:hypothetical protein C9F11_21140 [Streptomyces sp. YIM 121038]|uniref:hypothetical protein n=1 Tax=Streptomyces sp. YIM 121038 TaxID=2136401 RepID=UPI001161EA91|nr:hypothetical protein [Streptomyces sp. YIM 121038]QCX77860.1 hypothetical protein C9F11_21140 [Streptomyces sp. YIM 121038]